LAINVMELVGLLGWPLGDGEYPGIVRVASRRLVVPARVPLHGRIIGDGNHPASRRPVALDMRDALMHTHLLGPTGVGKSELLANLALADIAAGRAVAVVEPKGDLIEALLTRIPTERERDVVLLDPTDDASPVGLNPLAHGAPDLVADQVLAVFHGLYGDLLGPRSADVLHAGLLTLARSEHATLVALPLLLTNDRLRRRLTADLHDDVALAPFWGWFESLSDAERQQVVSPLMNKLRPFLLRERVRRLLGQAEPRFDLRQLFTERKILLVPLNKGALGSEGASLIGSLLVAQLWRAAQTRSSIAPERRHPVSVFVDEFQDYLNLPTDLADVLAQARGLSVGLTLAHQHLAQLSPSVRAAVLANARSRLLSVERRGCCRHRTQHRLA
jgi:type IV secretory pathway TraG/TraD family ATPase VirD4